MKNKKVIYLLLPLVAVIWGVILYRIFSIATPDPVLPAIPNTFSKEGIKTYVPDTFSIIAAYRDPFLDKAIPALKNKKFVKSSVPKVEKAVPSLKWPALTYYGIIKNKGSGKQLVMVSVNGKSNLMKVGDVVSGVQLMKVYKDSIALSFQKEKRMLRK